MLKVLHLEDQVEDAYLVERILKSSGLEASFSQVRNRTEYLAALDKGEFDLILADSGLPGFDGVEAVAAARQKFPDIPFVAVSGAISDERASAIVRAGATNYVSKEHLWQLLPAIRCEQEKLLLRRVSAARSRLVSAVQELSLTRDLNSIMAVVRRAARELTGADGATFVLRESGFCYYADEDAIAPLWKGQRFPLQACISGWAMLNRKPAIVEDIYTDARIPIDAYRPTFVKSLAMVPIRTQAPIGAIGNYWARRHHPTEEEVELLQALANTTAVAMENVQVYLELEKRVKDRTAELETANRELEEFSSAVSHDLMAPLRRMRAFSDIVLSESGDKLNEEGRAHLETIRASGQKMSMLIEDLLRLAKVSKVPLEKTRVNMDEMAKEIISGLAAANP